MDAARFGSRSMRGVAPRSAVCWVALCLGLIPGPAAAATTCSDIYPNAMQGPPPDWEAWDFGSACFTRWRVSAPDEEQALALRCRETPGARYLGTFGAGAIEEFPKKIIHTYYLKPCWRARSQTYQIFQRFADQLPEAAVQKRKQE